MKKWFILLVIFNLADFITTGVALKIGLAEANMLAVFMGYWGFGCFKLLLVTALAIVLWRKRDKIILAVQESWVRRHITGISVTRLTRSLAIGLGIIAVWNASLIVAVKTGVVG